MSEPSRDELKSLGMSILGGALNEKQSKKEEKLAMEVAIKQEEIDSLRRQLSLPVRKKKRKKRSST